MKNIISTIGLASVVAVAATTLCATGAQAVESNAIVSSVISNQQAAQTQDIQQILMDRYKVLIAAAPQDYIPDFDAVVNSRPADQQTSSKGGMIFL